MDEYLPLLKVIYYKAIRSDTTTKQSEIRLDPYVYVYSSKSMQQLCSTVIFSVAVTVVAFDSLSLAIQSVHLLVSIRAYQSRNQPPNRLIAGFEGLVVAAAAAVAIRASDQAELFLFQRHSSGKILHEMKNTLSHVWMLMYLSESICVEID